MKKNKFVVHLYKAFIKINEVHLPLYTKKNRFRVKIANKSLQQKFRNTCNNTLGVIYTFASMLIDRYDVKAFKFSDHIFKCCIHSDYIHLQKQIYF